MLLNLEKLIYLVCPKPVTAMTFGHIIDNWKLNKTFLAQKMGLQQKTLHYKLQTPESLTTTEKKKLKNILAEMKKDIEGIIS